jgi:histidine ammonia-lyase
MSQLPLPPIVVVPPPTKDMSVYVGPADPTDSAKTSGGPSANASGKQREAAEERQILLSQSLDWNSVVDVAKGAKLFLSPQAKERIVRSREATEALINGDKPVYGLNTGVGELCNTIVPPEKRREASKKIVMSHAGGIGEPLDAASTRAIMAAAVNNMSQGWSGVRLAMVQQLVDLLNKGVIPEVPKGGSIGYLTHMAHIGLVCIGQGYARVEGQRMTGAEALTKVGLAPIVLEAKEGLSMVQGTPCVTGLSSLALARMSNALEWGTAIASMTFENLGGQKSMLDPESLGLRESGGLKEIGAQMSRWIDNSDMLDTQQEVRTQDALSLRTIPHMHGALQETVGELKQVVNDELKSVTDNPAIGGTPENPKVHSQAHAVGVRLGLKLDACATAMAQFSYMSEHRTKRLLNGTVTGLTPFLASDKGGNSGLMITDYVARNQVAENQRHSMPASVAGGTTSGLQEDFLAHATPAANKLLQVVENTETILALELLAASQAYGVRDQDGPAQSPETKRLLDNIREKLSVYEDDRPLADAINAAIDVVRNTKPQ